MNYTFIRLFLAATLLLGSANAGISGDGGYSPKPVYTQSEFARLAQFQIDAIENAFQAGKTFQIQIMSDKKKPHIPGLNLDLIVDHLPSYVSIQDRNLEQAHLSWFLSNFLKQCSMQAFNSAMVLQAVWLVSLLTAPDS